MPANERDLEPCSERATRGYPALFCKLDLSQRSKPVQLFLLQEAIAKAARRTVQSERPGPTAGAFAFCGVRTAFCRKGLRARRSLRVGQRSGLAEALADRPGRARELSLRASRDLAPRRRLTRPPDAARARSTARWQRRSPRPSAPAGSRRLHRNAARRRTAARHRVRHRRWGAARSCLSGLRG